MMMVGSFRCCPLILWLALVAMLGSVFGLDLDRPLFGPPGSPVRLHESDPGLKKALEFAEERYNRGSNAMHLRKVSRLISATKQVTRPQTARCLFAFIRYLFMMDCMSYSIALICSAHGKQQQRCWRPFKAAPCYLQNKSIAL